MKKDNNKEITMSEIIDIFKALNILREYLEIPKEQDNGEMFVSITFDKKIKEKYNKIALKMIEFSKSSFEEKAKMLGMTVKYEK